MPTLNILCPLVCNKQTLRKDGAVIWRGAGWAFALPPLSLAGRVWASFEPSYSSL